jgi:non-ribosomal peptide synthetase component F
VRVGARARVVAPAKFRLLAFARQVFAAAAGSESLVLVPATIVEVFWLP